MNLVFISVESVVLFFVLYVYVEGSLHNQLKYFETLKKNDFSHSITKRGIQPSNHRYNTIKELSFKALGRQFRLILNPSKGLLSSHFKAYTVDGSGHKKPVWVNKDQFFEGRLFGEKDSDVSAHIDDGIVTAAIRTPEELYYVEPSWRHHPDDDNASMVVYRNSDVKSGWTNDFDRTGPSFCGYVKESVNGSEHFLNATDDDSEKQRVKRQTVDPYWEPAQTRCSLLLVADYRFFENMGGRNLKGTINFLISLIDRVNKIFLETEWRENEKQVGFRGMGFVIQEVMVHTEPTPIIHGEVHYNMDSNTWSVRDLLETFSRACGPKHCLCHLFTHQSFSSEGNILGLGYIASTNRVKPGGICSLGYVKNGYTLYLNSGLSTSRNHYGQRVITREADLVTAHGHNWGSEHDPDMPECSPDSRRGGSYLMYTYSVSGYDPNNKRFSPCSMRSIRAVLLAKASRCFSKPEESFCGNSLVEEGEECDAGLIGSENHDNCCDTTCRLRTTAVCSDKNSPCCRNCDLVRGGLICREGQRTACKKEAYCSGRSAECPPSPPQPDGTPCLDRGKCRNGECIPFCETLDLLSCMCDREEDACKRCCRPSQNSTCIPIEPVEIMRDGTPCIHGYCEKGECKKTVQDIVERFWDIIEDIDINSVLKFLDDNIVGTVIVISLIVWIPSSCLISYVDKKRKADLKAAMERPKRQNSEPFRPPRDSNTRLIRIVSRNLDSTSHRSVNVSGRGGAASENYRLYGERRYDSPNFERSSLPEGRSYSLSDGDYQYHRPHRYSPMHAASQGSVDMRGRRQRPTPVETYTAL